MMKRLSSLLLLAVAGCTPSRPAPEPDPEPEKPAPGSGPKLAVLLVVDQMRGDFLSRWDGLYAKDGFKRLVGEGASFTECHYPYANTMTGPGHATVSTGCLPSVHGIVANEWHDRFTGKEVNCAHSPRFSQVPPAPPPKDPKKKPVGIGPDLLLAPTFGDALKLATGGRGKVVSLSLKDRSAVLPTGRSKPDAVYWADANGRFVTSTAYRDSLHPWVKEFNAAGLAASWKGKSWDRLKPEAVYLKHAGLDDVRGEVALVQGGRAFPHPYIGGKGKEQAGYAAAVAASPAGNELLFALARKAIDAEKLGQRGEPDFLQVSFSSNDLVGHAFGPDSHEVLDITLRTDLIVRDLLALLDEKVGKGNYLVVMTADHGICPLPEVARKQGAEGWRMPPKPLLAAAELYLNQRFPGDEEKAVWIEASVSNMMYLNRGLAKSRGTTVEEAAKELAAWLARQPGFQRAYAQADLAGQVPDDDDLGRRW
ncbi:MAG: alkaline phosphatase family protein, partial [Gemmataceae bacterium]|nr:alkaline phosphatase family protein [Gemmataceae bacterium]